MTKSTWALVPHSIFSFILVRPQYNVGMAKRLIDKTFSCLSFPRPLGPVWRDQDPLTPQRVETNVRMISGVEQLVTPA